MTAGTILLSPDERWQQSSLVLLLTEGAQQVYSDTFDLERFWKLEEVGVNDKMSVQALEDENAVRQFKDTVRFEEGRYQVTWPWRTKQLELPDNFRLALKRLRSTYARLRKDDGLLKAYDDIIQGQLEKQVIEVAPKSPDGRLYYLPPSDHPSKNNNEDSDRERCFV